MKPVNIFAFIFLLIFAGCSTFKLMYDYADRLILWYLDDYFDLESRQKDTLLLVIQKNLQQHRHQELPQYAQLIRHVQESGTDGLTPEEAKVILQRFRMLYENVIQQLLPDTASLLSDLSDQQILHFQEVLQEQNEEIAKVFEDSLEEQEQKYEKRILKNFDQWFGDLSDQQEEVVKKMSKRWYDQGNRVRSRLKNRQDFQNRLLTFLKTQPNAKETESFLTELLQNQNSRYSQNLLLQRILEIDQLLTEEQRLHALKQLDEYLEVIDAILAEKE